MNTAQRNARASSRKQNYGTPPEFFAGVHRQFAFTLDVCAEPATAKCPRFWTKRDNCLTRSWGDEVCWMNPPYGDALPVFMERAFRQSLSGGGRATVVCLVPASTGTKWFQDWAMRGELWLVAQRLKFVGAPSTGFFPSVLVIFRGREPGRPRAVNRRGQLLPLPLSN